MRSSKKLDAWLEAHEKRPDFCEFMFGGEGRFDESYIEDKPYGPDAVINGFKLAKKAGARPVYQCDMDSGTLWFIGEEADILAKLEAQWKRYLDS